MLHSKKLKYRYGDSLVDCSVYTSAADVLSSTDKAIPVKMDNETYYLIAVNPANYSNYLLTDISTVIDGVTYRIAFAKIISKTMEFVYSGPKASVVGTVAESFYNKFNTIVSSGGHGGNVILRRSSSGARINFTSNVLSACLYYYQLIGSGGNGGSGGPAVTYYGGTTTKKVNGAGGGGGEAGARLTSTVNKTVTRVDCDYARSAGALSLKGFIGNTNVLNVFANYGEDGGDASEYKNGLGGNKNTDSANGKNGTTGSSSSVGVGGAGGVISGTSYGAGGNGGAGSTGYNLVIAGTKGGNWYYRVTIKYTCKG